MYAAAGETDTALPPARDMERLRQDGLYVQASSIALIYVGLGDLDRVFHWLDKACTGTASALCSCVSRVGLNRTDPRFKTLMARLGLRR
jgi:hypothetical protein